MSEFLGFLPAAIITIGAFVLTLFFGERALDRGRWISGWSIWFLIWLAAMLSVVAAASSQEDKKGPCARYETQMFFNGKTMHPARKCVDRWEWEVKP